MEASMMAEELKGDETEVLEIETSGRGIFGWRNRPTFIKDIDEAYRYTRQHMGLGDPDDDEYD